MRKAHRTPEPDPVNPEIAKIHAAAAASHAMRSSERSSTDSKNPYDRLGGPAHLAVPRRHQDSGLQFTDDAASMYSGSGMSPVTPRQSTERPGTAQAQRFVDAAALPPTTDLKGLDGRDSSLPSSYRRLRKAKSMFSTRQRSHHLGVGASLNLPRDSLDADRSPGFELPRTLRPSISFIRGNNRNGAKIIHHAKSHDAAIQLARTQFLEELNETQPRRPSFFTSRRTREHKPFRKTFRMTSGAGIGGESPEQPGSKWARSKSRTFSASIKHGLKRVFGLTKPVEQQSEINSTEAHSYAPAGHPLDHQQANNQVDHGADMQTFNDIPPLPVMRASAGRDSPCATASRVTSWADSTAANTIVTRRNGHRPALSLIEEHGDLNQQLPQVPIGTVIDSQPAPRQRASTRKFEDVVNSHDLYTALMQQMGRNVAHDPDESIHYGTVLQHRVIPERTSSVYSHRSRYSIRQVASGESTPVSFATAHRGDSQSPQRLQSIRRTESIKTSQGTFRPENNQPVGHRSAAKPPRSGFSIDEELGQSTESVVVARHDALSHRSYSPSIYSRTTRGRTLTETSDSEDDAPATWGEPGTATIFASERHSSPTRTLRSETPKAQQPSADWQNWMDLQIERIESASPTREHLREDPQLQDDEDEIFMGKLRRTRPRDATPTAVPYVVVSEDECGEVRPARTKVLTQNNFSRPFSRASSAQTILSSQKPDTSKTDPGVAANRAENIPPLPARSPMCVRSRKFEAYGTKPAEESDTDFVDRVENAPPVPARSPMRIRTANLPGRSESPTPQRNGTEPQKRMWTHEQHKRLSVRRPIANGRQGQFRSMRNYRDFRPIQKENARHENDEMMDEYHRMQEFQASISSKHMVEMFLNSRRRPAETNMADDNAGEAFL